MKSFAFNRIVVLAGTTASKFAEFLGVKDTDELDLTEMQSILYDRLYRLGSVRHLDGSRANRRRASKRQAEKRSRAKGARRNKAQTRRVTRNRKTARRGARQTS